MVSIVINNVSPINEYDATAAQTVFNTDFPIFQGDEVKIYQYGENDTPNDATDVLVLNVDYTLSNLGIAGGFTFTLLVGATLNDHLTAIRDIPIDRVSQYALEGKFSTDDVNLDLNYQTMISQDRRMYERIKGLYYPNAAIIADLDRRLPKLAAKDSWRMNETGTAIEAVEIISHLVGENLYGVTTGAANTYLVTIADFEGNSDGLDLLLKINVTNTGASTININSVGAVSIRKGSGAALAAGDLVTGYTYNFVFHNGAYYFTDMVKAVEMSAGVIPIATTAEVTTGTNDSKAVTPLKLEQKIIASLNPTGMIGMWGTITAPSGWLLCQGAAVNRTTYAALFAVIGITFGVGDGVTTFNVPNYSGRTPIGVGTGAGLTPRSIAATGGAQEDILTTAQLAAHNHTFTTGASTNNSGINAQNGNRADIPATITTASKGSGDAHNTMQPFLVINFIIKT